jgi:hypothetical protein
MHSDFRLISDSCVEDGCRLESMSCSHVTDQIIRAAIKIHRKLGPGLLESAYEACLAYELEEAGLYVQRQKACRSYTAP